MNQKSFVRSEIERLADTVGEVKSWLNDGNLALGRPIKFGDDYFDDWPNPTVVYNADQQCIDVTWTKGQRYVLFAVFPDGYDSIVLGDDGGKKPTKKAFIRDGLSPIMTNIDSNKNADADWTLRKFING